MEGPYQGWSNIKMKCDFKIKRHHIGEKAIQENVQKKKERKYNKKHLIFAVNIYYCVKILF